MRKAKPTARMPRRRCRRCNDLDPANHRASVHEETYARLTLAIDIKELIRVNEVFKKGELWRKASGRWDRHECWYCDLIVRALDCTVKEWRQLKGPVVMESVQNRRLLLRVVGEDGEECVITIQGDRGKFAFSLIFHYSPILN